MASPIDAPSAAAGGDKDAVRPPVTSFTPSMWADSFNSFSSVDETNNAATIEVLKQEARNMLMAEGKTRSEKLVLIDTLERLGIGYHFEQEIEHQLQQIFLQSSDDQEDNDDLFIASLQFRVLRQHRHHVPCSVFDKFIYKVEGDNNKKFKESLDGDAKGLLSLYEAAHLQTTDQGEDILEEAVAFTTHHLKRLLLEEKLDPPSSSLQHQVSRALDQPLHNNGFLLFPHPGECGNSSKRTISEKKKVDGRL